MYPQKMRMKRDTPLIAIKMDTNGHRRGRNRQIKRVTSKTPKSCRKTTSWSWCVKGEDQLARCATNKLRVHHKAAIKSIKSHSEKIIATFPAPFSHEKLPISVIFSQNVRKIFTKFSHSFPHLEMPIFWEIVERIIANLRGVHCRYAMRWCVRIHEYHQLIGPDVDVSAKDANEMRYTTDSNKNGHKRPSARA